MAKKFDVCVGRKDEKADKTYWTKIGVVLTNKNGGLTLKLEQVPVGWDGWASLFEPKAQEGGRRGNDDGDPIPF